MTSTKLVPLSRHGEVYARRGSITSSKKCQLGIDPQVLPLSGNASNWLAFASTLATLAGHNLAGLSHRSPSPIPFPSFFSRRVLLGSYVTMSCISKASHSATSLVCDVSKCEHCVNKPQIKTMR